MEYVQEKKSRPLARKESLVSFLLREVDLHRFEIRIFYASARRTTHIEVWRVGEYPFFTVFSGPSFPRLIFEYYPGWVKRAITIPGELLRVNREHYTKGG